MSNVPSLRFIARTGFILCLVIPFGALAGVFARKLEVGQGVLLIGAAFGVYAVSVISDALADLAEDVTYIKRQLAPRKPEKPRIKNLAPDAPATPDIIRPPRQKIDNDASDQLPAALYSRRWQGGKAQRAVRKKTP